MTKPFIDRVRIFVKGGRGGNGAVAFLREKFRPKGGPAGGDGGKGGDVILVATSSKHTLLDFKYRRHFRAQDGQHGKGKKMKGKDGEDLIIYVPLGTVVIDEKSGEVLCDLVKEGQRCVVAKGGRGGRGNAHFATPTDQAPRFAEEGEEGEERWVVLELKLIADVGIIGLPNAGKSTLLKKLTRANPKVGDYPFTTLHPNLGVLEIDEERRLVLADIPGLIENAHRGAGLGLEFLRHIERTRILLHLVDISGTERDPIEAFNTVNRELGHYSGELLNKPQIVALSKADLLTEEERAREFENWLDKEGYPHLRISALTGQGIDTLKEMLWREYERLKTDG
jgi:GTP-binding protein